MPSSRPHCSQGFLRNLRGSRNRGTRNGRRGTWDRRSILCNCMFGIVVEIDLDTPTCWVWVWVWVKILALDEELNTGLENCVRQRKSFRFAWSGLKSECIKYGGDHLSKAVPPLRKNNRFLSILSFYFSTLNFCNRTLWYIMEFVSDISKILRELMRRARLSPISLNYTNASSSYRLSNPQHPSSFKYFAKCFVSGTCDVPIAHFPQRSKTATWIFSEKKLDGTLDRDIKSTYIVKVTTMRTCFSWNLGFSKSTSWSSSRLSYTVSQTIHLRESPDIFKVLVLDYVCTLQTFDVPVWLSRGITEEFAFNFCVAFLEGGIIAMDHCWVVDIVYRLERETSRFLTLFEVFMEIGDRGQRVDWLWLATDRPSQNVQKRYRQIPFLSPDQGGTI